MTCQVSFEGPRPACSFNSAFWLRAHAEKGDDFHLGRRNRLMKCLFSPPAKHSAPSVVGASGWRLWALQPRLECTRVSEWEMKGLWTLGHTKMDQNLWAPSSDETNKTRMRPWTLTGKAVADRNGFSWSVFNIDISKTSGKNSHL